MIPPCAGKWELFDSIDPIDHREARKLCRECPMSDWCATQLASVQKAAHSRRYGAEGTWAGKLVGVPAGYGKEFSRKRLSSEEEMFTEAEARVAHNEFTRGIVNDRTRIGERVYQRRIGRAKRARQKDAA